MPTLGISYHVGVDGISLLLVLADDLPDAARPASAWHAIETGWKEFVITMLLLETGMLGVFVALDLFLFYVFWEAMLIPMYLIIGIWGGPQPRVRRGQVRPLHAGRLAPDAGRHPGPVLPARRRHRRPTPSTCPLLAQFVLPRRQAQNLLFLAFALAFAIKVPMFPFHTWLPDAHVEAPTAGQRDPRRRAAEDGHLRLPALLPAALPPGEPRLRAAGSSRSP